ncbi:MAG: PBP1A family penicillin-binding protein [Rhodobacteraceae bacterium]|nr:PBP1A family penicillin-binding protein [Paracoccaceae bacterium]
MLRPILSFFGFLFSWITNGLVMGMLLLGAVFWMYGRDLPNHEQLARYEPPTISTIYSGEGRIMDEFARERRIFTPVDEIPDIVKNAFISAEDKNFRIHAGYDPLGIIKALIDAAQGKRLRGASTITQQVMKNFLLDGDRSAERKIKEIILAARLENVLSKDQILELYLNEIFLGQNSFGVTAAAQTYFNKTLEELTVEEAAYLAILPKAPSTYHPVREKDRAIARRDFVLKEMTENGYLDEATAEAARQADLRTVQAHDFPSYKASLPARDYVTDEIRRQLSETFGEEEFFGGGMKIRATVDPDLQREAARALRGGLESYDRKQGIWRGPAARLDKAVLATEDAWRDGLAGLTLPRDIAGWHPAVVLDLSDAAARIGIEGEPEIEGGHGIPIEDMTWARPLDDDGEPGRKAKKPEDLLSIGDVIYVKKIFGPVEGAEKDENGNIPEEFKYWSLRQIPEIEGGFMAMDTNTGRVLAMQGGFSYQHSVFNRATQATRQPGSAFKPFVYAAALDVGYTPATIVIDAPIEVRTPEGMWRPKNSSNKFYGPSPMRTGIERSRNLMTIRLAQSIGMDVVAAYAERFGVYDDMAEHLANSLGAQETTLFRIVAAYAMFANGGERVIPTMVDRVQDRRGRTIYRHDRRKCEVCRLDSDLPPGEPPQIVNNRHRVMDAVTAYQLTSMMRGVVERGTAAGQVRLDAQVAGKTGTTNQAKDVWFVGFTPNIVAGCYMGMDLPQPLGRWAYGGTMCGPVFESFMKQALERYGRPKFKVPEHATFVKIDRYTGERLSDGASGANVVAELFREGEEPQFGALSIIDGGFAMGSDLPLFGEGEGDLEGDADDGPEVTTQLGVKKKIPKRATFGSLSSGGLY